MAGFESTLTALSAADRTPKRQAPEKGTSNPGDAYLVSLDDLPELDLGADQAMKKAQACLTRGMNQEMWLDKCEGLQIMRSLLVQKPDYVVEHLKDITAAVVAEIANLRSSVARLAILFLGDLYAELGSAMEKELPATVDALQRKASAEASVFIKEDVERAMGVMILCQNPSKVLPALLPLAESKHGQVRCSTAYFLTETVGRLGEKVVEHKDAERLLKTIASLLQDQLPAARYNARKLLFVLAPLSTLDRYIDKHTQGNDQKLMKTTLEALRTKGLEEPTATTTLGRGTARPRVGSTTRPGKAPSAAAKPGSAFKGPDGTDVLQKLSADLASKDWRAREGAIDLLVMLVSTKAAAFNGSTLNVFFEFVPLLTDSNSKVNLRALQALPELVAPLGNSFDTVLAEMLPAVAHNLVSKNAAIQQAALSAMQACTSCIAPSVLVPALALTVRKSNAAVQECLVTHLCDSVAGAVEDARDAKLVNKHYVPLAVQLAQDKRLELQVPKLWKVLHACLGDALLQHPALPAPILALVEQALASR
jgi:hypothetical protein